MRGHWPKGRRRHATPEVAAFVRALGSVRAVADAAGVSPRAVQHWREGTKRPALATLQRVINALLGRGMGYGPQLSAWQASVDLGPDSLVVGVGEYTLRVATGCPLEEAS